MRTSVLVGLAAATAAALFAGGVVSASGSQQTDHDRQHSTARPQFAPHAAVDTATELKFTAIAPCRAVDTRHAGGDLLSDHSRTFKVGGSGFTGQGGPSGGCGLPTNVTAIAATVTTVARHAGFLKAWAAGAPQPATSFMNYGTSFNASTGGTIPVGTGAAITILNHGGPTDVIVDITGYYMKPLFASVAANGTKIAGSRVVTSVDHTVNSGVYVISFDRDLSACGVTATQRSFGDAIDASVNSPDTTQVFVHIYDSNTHTSTDSDFAVNVTC